MELVVERSSDTPERVGRKPVPDPWIAAALAKVEVKDEEEQEVLDSMARHLTREKLAVMYRRLMADGGMSLADFD
jgi:hypothetical protein